MTFHVGQEVVCVIDDWISATGRLPSDCPVKGTVYVVTDVRVVSGMTCPPYEWVGIAIQGYGDVLWSARAFRPVIKRKTDISIFTAMLSPTKPKVDA